ncbi:MAG: phosphohydrolase [Hyphomicrobiales bacterium]|nr:MAG: phosphohydrolase [Hyphomicrobiales bacterium]
MSDWLNRAMACAAIYHAGQTDKAGQDYIFHLKRVADRLSGDDQAVAWLHDIIEDTCYRMASLQQAFPVHIANAVDAMTKRGGESYATYLNRVKTNDMALRVKLADIADNSDPERLAKLDEKTRQRLKKKYETALEILLQEGE